MATLYKKRLTKNIKQLFDGLTTKHQDELVEYYFECYGGEDGCEECFETHALCGDCHNALSQKAYKLTHAM